MRHDLGLVASPHLWHTLAVESRGGTLSSRVVTIVLVNASLTTQQTADMLGAGELR
jgi:hypothetical protein